MKAPQRAQNASLILFASPHRVHTQPVSSTLIGGEDGGAGVDAGGRYGGGAYDGGSSEGGSKGDGDGHV